ncbi:MAG TPA: hypothetical protein P5509_04225 [Bacteroidales bacterium]|nr:hypothetical protein [Bacteroidales bacterium]
MSDKSRWEQLDKNLSDKEKALIILLEEYMKEHENLSQITIFFDINSNQWRVAPSTFANSNK